MSTILRCEAKRIQPFKFRIKRAESKGRKSLFEYVKSLPALNMCGVSGCSECEEHYGNILNSLFDKGALEVELFRVKEPDVSLLFFKPLE